MGVRSDKINIVIKRFIPAKYHYALSNIKNSWGGGYAQTHYSQFGEDVVIAKLLKEKSGFYIDVGAHHPKRYSNTYLLYKRGWQGINIDPNPESIHLFDKARPRDTNVCVGVGAKKEELAYYMFSDPAVNSFQEEEAKRWANKSWITPLGVKQVPVDTLQSILSTLPDIPPVNLLTIDVEGMDLEVLQSNDWEKIRPDMIVVESDIFNPTKPFDDPLFEFLVSQHGYTLRGLVGPSLIFANPTL